MYLEERLVVYEIIFDKKYNNSFAVFLPTGPQKINYNLYSDVKQKDYESNGAIIDKNQLNNLSKYYQVVYR